MRRPVLRDEYGYQLEQIGQRNPPAAARALPATRNPQLAAVFTVNHWRHEVVTSHSLYKVCNKKTRYEGGREIRGKNAVFCFDISHAILTACDRTGSIESFECGTKCQKDVTKKSHVNLSIHFWSFHSRHSFGLCFSCPFPLQGLYTHISRM